MRRSFIRIVTACGVGLGCASLVLAQAGSGGTSGGSGAAAPPATGASGGTGAASGAVVGGSAGANLNGGGLSASPAQTQPVTGSQSGVGAGGQATTGQLPGGTGPGTFAPGGANGTAFSSSSSAQVGAKTNATQSTAAGTPAAGATIGANATAAGGSNSGTTVSGSVNSFGTPNSTVALQSSNAASGAITPTALGFFVRPGGNGLRVGSIATGGVAQRGGFQLNDEIVSVNGTAVNSDAELADVMTRNGQNTLNFGVRRNGQLHMFSMMPPVAAGAAATAGTPTGSAGLQIGTAGQASVANNPFRAAMAPSANPTNGSPGALTGDFSKDFSSWGLEMGNALQRQQATYQTQISQLSNLNNRINAMRMSMMNSTGDSAANVQMLEQLRQLRSEVGNLSQQSSGDFQVQLNALRDRLNLLNPATQPTGTATAAGVGAGTSGSSGTGTAAAPRTVLPR